MALQEYDFVIRHQRGTEKVVADALFRALVGTPAHTDPVDGAIDVVHPLPTPNATDPYSQDSAVKFGDPMGSTRHSIPADEENLQFW